MTTNQIEHSVEIVEANPNFKVLRRVPPATINSRVLTSSERLVLIIDTETTGLDLLKDEVIELGIIGAAYEDSGITDVVQIYDGLREPSIPLSDMATQITGLTRDKLEGHQLDLGSLQKLVDKADLIIAHNAAFDRPMCERLLPIFKTKPWACSATEVNWRAQGFESSKLKFLLLESGFFYDAHRAMDDCQALLHLMRQQLVDNRTVFSQLIEGARKPTYDIFLQAHYEFRHDIRARGYRWNSRSHNRGQGWNLTVNDEQLEEEIEFLKTNFKLGSIDYSVKKLNAFTRYRLP